MQTLRELQLSFARAVFDTRIAERFAPAVYARGLSGPRRIQVYRHNLFANLTAALAGVYRVVQRLVGEAYFLQAATAYVQAFPSASGDIHRYGDRFGEFLGQLPNAADYPYLVDVATLEWAYHEVFHSEISPRLNLETLHNVPQADYPLLRFRLQPAARLLASRHPIIRIWQVNQDDWLGDQTVSLDEGAVNVLVRRKARHVVLQALASGDYVLLEQLDQGETLADAHARAVDAEPGFDLSAALCRYVTQGTLVEAYAEGIDSRNSSDSNWRSQLASGQFTNEPAAPGHSPSPKDQHTV